MAPRAGLPEPRGEASGTQLADRWLALCGLPSPTPGFGDPGSSLNMGNRRRPLPSLKTPRPPVMSLHLSRFHSPDITVPDP